MLELCGWVEYSGCAMVAGGGDMMFTGCGCVGGVDDVVCGGGCIVNCELAAAVPPVVGGVGDGGILVVAGGCWLW